MLRRALALSLLGLAVTAPAVAAQSLEGSNWATSPAGHMVFVAFDYEREQTTVRLVAPAGEVSPPETLAGVDDTASVAVGARGDVIVAWVDVQAQVWARYRPPGGAFGGRELVATGYSEGSEGLPVAIDATGAAILAWGGTDGGLHVRFRDPVTSWGAEQRLGGHDVSRPRLALAGAGTAALAWRQRGPTGINSSQIAVSTRAAGAPFGPAQVLAGPKGRPESAVVATNERGDAGVLWIDLDTHDTFSVHAVFARAGARFGHPVTISRDDATGPAIAVLPSGRMILAWRSNGAFRAGARVRSASGRLGRAHIVTRKFKQNGRPVALVAGRGAVGWSDVAHGEATVVRVAQATAAGGFERPHAVGRVRSYPDEPAFTLYSPELAVVARPPLDPDDPIHWRRVAL